MIDRQAVEMPFDNGAATDFASSILISYDDRFVTGVGASGRINSCVTAQQKRPVANGQTGSATRYQTAFSDGRPVTKRRFRTGDPLPNGRNGRPVTTAIHGCHSAGIRRQLMF
jgi:hypothetical protein